MESAAWTSSCFSPTPNITKTLERSLKVLTLITILLMVVYAFQQSTFETTILEKLGKIRKFYNNFTGFSNRHCQPPRNIYFLKMHKTGSTTFNSILTRYAWTHDLTMATFSNQPFETNIPHPIIANIIPPFDGKRKYNMMTYHAVYEENDLKKILNTEEHIHYLTLLREPLARLRSFLNFYANLTHHLGLKSKFPVEELLSNLSKDSGKYPLRFEPIRNTMAYEFGKISNLSAQSEDFRREVELLSNRFFVGLTEYYMETIILVRRLLCLKSHKDVIFMQVRKYSYKVRTKNEEEKRKKLCEWSDKDCYLYDYFNKTFWRRVREQGQDFWEEVDHINLLNVLVTNYCSPIISHIKKNGWNQTKDKAQQFKTLKIPVNRWSASFILSPLDCAFMYLDDRALQVLFYYTQNLQQCKTLELSKKCILDVNVRIYTMEECIAICKSGAKREDILYQMLSLKHSYLFEGVDAIKDPKG